MFGMIYNIIMENKRDLIVIISFVVFEVVTGILGGVVVFNVGLPSWLWYLFGIADVVSFITLLVAVLFGRRIEWGNGYLC